MRYSGQRSRIAPLSHFILKSPHLTGLKMNQFYKFFRYLLTDKGITIAIAYSFNQLSYAIIYPFVPVYLCQERHMDYAVVSIIFPLFITSVSPALGI